jgi:hypothetical protein
VARDRRQPGIRLARLDAGEQRAMGGEEDVLRRILGLGAVAEEGAAGPGDRAAVDAIERVGPCASGLDVDLMRGSGGKSATRRRCSSRCLLPVYAQTAEMD